MTGPLVVTGCIFSGCMEPPMFLQDAYCQGGGFMGPVELPVCKTHAENEFNGNSPMRVSVLQINHHRKMRIWVLMPVEREDVAVSERR